MPQFIVSAFFQLPYLLYVIILGVVRAPYLAIARHKFREVLLGNTVRNEHVSQLFRRSRRCTKVEFSSTSRNEYNVSTILLQVSWCDTSFATCPATIGAST